MGAGQGGPLVALPLMMTRIGHSEAIFLLTVTRSPTLQERSAAPPFDAIDRDSGSRVIFDQLGPPWLKHGCTDRNPIRTTHTPTYVRTGSILADLVFAPEAVPALGRLSPFVELETWRPLCGRDNAPLTDLGKHVRFPIAGVVQVLGTRLYVPSIWFGTATIYRG